MGPEFCKYGNKESLREDKVYLFTRNKSLRSIFSILLTHRNNQKNRQF